LEYKIDLRQEKKKNTFQKIIFVFGRKIDMMHLGDEIDELCSVDRFDSIELQMHHIQFILKFANFKIRNAFRIFYKKTKK
jgi:hypothetical protein